MTQKNRPVTWETGQCRSPNRTAKRRKELLKDEDSSTDPRDNIKCTNICIMEVPEGKDRKKGTENVFDIMAKNFPNLGKKQTSRSHRQRESQTR